MAYLDVLTRNLHMGAQKPGEAADTIWRLVAETKPDVVSLQECRLANSAIITSANYRGWKVCAEWTHGGKGDERGDTILLIAPHVTERWRRLSIMRLRWTVLSHHQRHEPRRYWRSGITVRGQQWRVTAAHWPTPWGRNRVAFVETQVRCRLSLLASGRNPSVEVGDINEPTGRLRSWAQRAGLRVAGQGVDGAVTRRCRVASMKNLGKHGSDHDSFLIRVTTN